MRDGDNCVVCGVSHREHTSDYIASDKEHTIFKEDDKATRLRSRNMLRMRLKNPGREVVFYCKKHGGACVEDNLCLALKTHRGGDFGWGECVHSENIQCGRWDEREGQWVLDRKAYNAWMRKNIPKRRRSRG